MIIRRCLLVSVVIFLSVADDENSTRPVSTGDKNYPNQPPNVAIVGAGVIGLSTALAICESSYRANITIFTDQNVNETTSYHSPGFFVFQNSAHRKFGKPTFERFSRLFDLYGGRTGVERISGYLVSYNKTAVKNYEKIFGDIVYGYRMLHARELDQFNRINSYGVAFTTFVANGERYITWLRSQVEACGVPIINRHVDSLTQLAFAENFDQVVNCAGVRGSQLAGDDLTPNEAMRSVVIQVDAPWQKMFVFEDLATFTFPSFGRVYLGSTNGVNDTRRFVTREEELAMVKRYSDVQPAFAGVPIIGSVVDFTTKRKYVRLQVSSLSGKLIVHNYGHGLAGYALSWGCAVDVVGILQNTIPQPG